MTTANRAWETSVTTGTGNITLAGAVNGFTTLNAGVGIGVETTYWIQNDSAQWETGKGELSDATTFVRTTVEDNSLGDTSNINFTGALQIYIGPNAEDFAARDALISGISDELIVKDDRYIAIEDGETLNNLSTKFIIETGIISAGKTLSLPLDIYDEVTGLRFFESYTIYEVWNSSVGTTDETVTILAGLHSFYTRVGGTAIGDLVLQSGEKVSFRVSGGIDTAAEFHILETIDNPTFTKVAEWAVGPAIDMPIPLDDETPSLLILTGQGQGDITFTLPVSIDFIDDGTGDMGQASIFRMRNWSFGGAPDTITIDGTGLHTILGTDFAPITEIVIKPGEDITFVVDNSNPLAAIFIVLEDSTDKADANHTHASTEVKYTSFTVDDTPTARYTVYSTFAFGDVDISLPVTITSSPTYFVFEHATNAGSEVVTILAGAHTFNKNGSDIGDLVLTAERSVTLITNSTGTGVSFDVVLDSDDKADTAALELKVDEWTLQGGISGELALGVDNRSIDITTGLAQGDTVYTLPLDLGAFSTTVPSFGRIRNTAIAALGVDTVTIDPGLHQFSRNGVPIVGSIALLPGESIEFLIDPSLPLATKLSISYDSRDKFNTAGGTITGAITETRVAMGANDVDVSLGSIFTKTLSSDPYTLTLSNTASSGLVSSFVLELIDGDLAAVTWFTNTVWDSATVPTLTSKDILAFYTHDAGATWNGVVVAQGVA